MWRVHFVWCRYIGLNSPCWAAGEARHVADIDTFKTVPSGSEEQLAAAIAHGPVAVGIQANQPDFQHYKNGTFDGACGTEVDHGVTAVGMTDEIPIMVAAVVITVGIMMVAADPLAKFIEKNPTLVMLALAFLVMIGLVLIADGFGFHVPKGYIYAAMGFSIGVELLNIMQRNRRVSRQAAAGGNV